MTREQQFTRTIALLATGDEICQGDIINSNSQEIAMRLVGAGMQVRLHMSAPDTINEIKTSLAFLLQTHDVVIITGGLGPTSDDLTRYALSEVTECPLQFDDTTWEEICARLKRFGYDPPPESNRQQALFPQGATIIPNLNGTAAGCWLKKNNKWIFMLPGPPPECLPMVDNVILPLLKAAGFPQNAYYRKWLLFGVSEGKIAQELDLLVKPYDCVTGYRLTYPYIEFKLHSQNKNDFDAVIPLIEAAIQPYLIGDGQLPASSLLKNTIAAKKTAFVISDFATGGALQHMLTTPDTLPYLTFSHQLDSCPFIEVHGLNNYWQQQNVNSTQLDLVFINNNHENKLQIDIPLRGKRVIKYAVEFTCWKILEFTNVIS